MNKKNICIILSLFLFISAASFADKISSLIDDLGDWNKDKAKQASDKLAAIGKPAVPFLIKALESNSRNKKRYAARALRNIGQDASDAIPALSILLKDNDAQVREYAVEALGQMHDQAETMIVILQNAMADSNKDVRSKAIMSVLTLKKHIEQTKNRQEDVVINESHGESTKAVNSDTTELRQESREYTETEPVKATDTDIIVDAGKPVHSQNNMNKMLDLEMKVNQKYSGSSDDIDISSNSHLSDNNKIGEKKKDANKIHIENGTLIKKPNWWFTPQKFGQYEVKPALIGLITILILLMIIFCIAIKKTHDGIIIFFYSYSDLFFSVLPIIVGIGLCVVLEFHSNNEEYTSIWLIYLGILCSFLYNYVKAFIDNWNRKFLAFCVGTSRNIIIFILPVILLLSFLEMAAERSERDSPFGKIVAVLVFISSILLLHSLVGTMRYQLRSEEEYETCCNGEANENPSESDRYSDTSSEVSPYVILGIPTNSTINEIKEAYRKLSQQYHPDKVAHLGPELQQVAHEKMKKINQAYESLTQQV
ncbi:MAG: HEAT repeat domain-containing protein [Phycisphaerae bacterium]|jgi:DnaJ-domain-containing protein 1